MKKGKLKIILLILAMTLSTFASGLTWEDFEGNDEFGFKVDPPKSTTFYFDEEGEKVTGPTDFWVKFTMSGDELSFETKNLELKLLSIKGGPNFRVYTDLDESESGLTAPINPNTEEPYGISHYSFEFTIIPLPPPPDPEGSIKITKIVVDEEEEVITNDNTKFFFKVEFWSEEEWIELEDSPFEITGNGSKTISKLPMGEYKITEVDIDEDYELITENGIEVELVKDGDKEEVEFTNMKEGETPPPPGWTGNIRIQKSVTDPRNSNPSLSGFEFTLYKVLEGEDLLVGSRTTNSAGTASFTDLEEGQYMLFETDTLDFSEGIPTTGRLINLNPDTVDEGNLVVNVTNTRIYPPDDDDDEPRPRPRPEPEPEEEDEEVLEITVVEEPVPEAPPSVEVVEEVIPLATLPKTGSSDQLLISGLGAALIALGLIKKKR